MEYNKLGNTDLEVSKICLGTMTWGEQNTEQEAWEQLDYAIGRKINFIDTAELYAVPARAETQGLTEAYIGTWLSARKNREDLIIATKIAGPGAYTKHIRENKIFTPSTIVEAVEGSLKRLQTDYIDLYQFHWPERSTNFFGNRVYNHDEEWEDNFRVRLESVQKLIEDGKIRYVGISNETPWGLMNFLRISDSMGLPRVMSVQNPYSLLNRTYETGLAEISIREHAGLLAYSPLACGRLTNKYIEKTDTPDCRLNKFKAFGRYNNQNALDATEAYYKLAQKLGVSLATLSLSWVNDQRFVTSNIIGATNLTQLKENIDSIDYKLDKETIKEINKIHERYPNPST